MFAFIANLFGPKGPIPSNIVPTGTRDVVEFSWVEPGYGGEPSVSDIERLTQALGTAGWASLDVEHQNHAVAVFGQRDDVRLTLSIGHNGEGPWVGFIELYSIESHASSAQWVDGIHDALVAVGAKDLRWYEGSSHAVGNADTPWKRPSQP